MNNLKGTFSSAVLKLHEHGKLIGYGSTRGMTRWIFQCIAHMAFLVFLISCGSKAPIIHRPSQKPDDARKIAIFLDGTASDEGSYTNVSKLYNLMSLQKNPTINTAYLKGVGTGSDFLGILTGSGIRKEVCNAYLYLAENYKHKRGDEIYLFGFSRGAYAARILAGLIHASGIIDVSTIPYKKRLPLIQKMYKAHKGKKSLQERREDVFKVSKKPIVDNYTIEFMGLWDTVESLGLPDYNDDYYLPMNKYLDQLCNVKRAAQALSLNDNRSLIFTPILLNVGRLAEECAAPVDREKVVNEVWFFGAHSDVGGGSLNTNISGVSLNWMIQQIKPYGLLPQDTEVYEDRFDITNDPRQGFMKIIFPKKSRKLVFFSSMKGYKNEKLKIHQSVFDRLENGVLPHETNLIQSFSECFEKNERGGYTYIESSDCFEIEK